MTLAVKRFTNGIHQRRTHYTSNRRWQALTAEVASQAAPVIEKRPVIFFNASTRLQAMSQNAAYSLLTAMAVKLSGVPVIQFVCNSGMQRCVLGSDRDDYGKLPPCKLCTRQSRAVFKNMDTRWFEQRETPELNHRIAHLSVGEMETFTYKGVPLGFWAVNSLRWMLRRYTLEDSPVNRSFFRSFILSAWNVYTQFTELIRAENPQAVVVFNGMFYPEAAVRHASLEHNVRVITHEVGLRPYTAFFTTGEATAYPMEIDPSFQLTEEMDKRLDDYLSTRFRGDFSMAGIRFWPEMKQPDPGFMAKAEKFHKIVPVFTNVIFDTSQVHANTIFQHMFAWLENVHTIAKTHPEVLFVIRAHPDESRPGKESRESVSNWIEKSGTSALPNVIFYSSNQYINSYDLIRHAHLVMVYNSTIGLEAALLGKPVIAGGKARFTQLETSFFPSSVEEYNLLLERLLTSDKINTPSELKLNARRFLYHQLYATSLDFKDYIEGDNVWKGYVKPKDFPVSLLEPERSITMKTVLDGILHQGNFTNPL